MGRNYSQVLVAVKLYCAADSIENKPFHNITPKTYLYKNYLYNHNLQPCETIRSLIRLEMFSYSIIPPTINSIL